MWRRSMLATATEYRDVEAAHIRALMNGNFDIEYHEFLPADGRADHVVWT